MTATSTRRYVQGHVRRSASPRSHINIPLGVVALLAVYTGIGVFFLWKMPTGLDPLLARSYVAILVAYFIMAGLSIVVSIGRSLDLFDPLVLISILYVSIFTVAPMRDLIIGNYYYFGVNLFVYAIKGTVVAVAGFIALCAGYWRFSLGPKRVQVKEHPARAQYDTSMILRVTISIWAVSFAFGLLNAVSGGKSITYVLTLGIIGAPDTGSTIDAPLGFANAMALAMVPTAIIYFHFSRSVLLKGSVQIITLMLLASQGFRYIVVIYILTHFYVWFMKQGRMPRMYTLITLLCLLSIFVGVMGFYRGALRSGSDIDWTLFSVKEVTDAIFDNLAIYKTYYGVIVAVPDIIPYGMGAQIFGYTAVFMVPRFLWASKPYPSVNEPVRAGVSDYAAEAGAAYPSIGEYYFEFGILGVLFFMYVLGETLSLLHRRYRASSDIFDIVLYSVVVTAMFQVIIRGYTPSNFYMLLFMVAPVFFIQKIARLHAPNRTLNSKFSTDRYRVPRTTAIESSKGSARSRIRESTTAARRGHHE